MARPAFLTGRVGQAAGLATTTAALAVLPFCLDDYILHWTITVLMFVVIALCMGPVGALRTIIVRTYRVLRPRGLRLCPVVHRLAFCIRSWRFSSHRWASARLPRSAANSSCGSVASTSPS